MRVRYECRKLNPEDTFASTGKNWKYEFEDNVDEVDPEYECSEDATATVEAVTLPDLTKRAIKDQYKKKHRPRGKDYVDDITADLTLMHLSDPVGNPMTQIVEIEKKLKEVVVSLNEGHWITAQIDLVDVVVESPLTQELFDKIQADIALYVASEYN